MMQAMKYCRLIGLHPTYALVVLAAVGVFGGYSMWLSGTELDTALAMVLFVHMFLSSSGFVLRARQGHLDPLLTAGQSRMGGVAGHWAISVLPGVGAWLLVACWALVLRHPAALSVFAGRRMVALLIVSAVGWAAGTALPRGGAGVAWIALIVAAMLRHPDVALLVRGDGVLRTLEAAFIVVACPFLLLGSRPSIDAAVLAIAAGTSLVVAAIAWHLIAGLDVYLEEHR